MRVVMEREKKNTILVELSLLRFFLRPVKKKLMQLWKGIRTQNLVRHYFSYNLCDIFSILFFVIIKD